MARTTKSLVIDASVARSCGDENATYPTSVRCRDFLIVMKDYQHRLVMNPEIKAEWDKHQSRFARQWLRQMIAKKLFQPVPDLPIDSELWSSIEELANSDKERAAMTKDLLLLEATLATDRCIASLDENTARTYYAAAAQTIAKLRDIVWINPDKPGETPLEWLKAGAPDDDFRKLGNAQ